MPDTHHKTALDYLILDDAVLLRQCEVDCYRASGPGGQKRNKTSSAVRLRHVPSGLIVTATEERSQHTNKRRALRRLREAIALDVRSDDSPGVDGPSETLRGFVQADGNLAIGRRDERYCMVVAEVLDVLRYQRARVRDTARRLGLSTAHLLKFLAKDPKVWDRVNRMRAAEGQPPLRRRSSS